MTSSEERTSAGRKRSRLPHREVADGRRSLRRGDEARHQCPVLGRKGFPDIIPVPSEKRVH